MHIHHLALRVADLERASGFYRDLLGLQELRRQHDEGGKLRSVWLRSGEALLMLETELAGAGDSHGSGHVLAFAVDDLGHWTARLEQAGIPIEARSAHTLFVRDPDGHRVGLSTYPRPAGPPVHQPGTNVAPHN